MQKFSRSMLQIFALLETSRNNAALLVLSLAIILLFLLLSSIPGRFLHLRKDYRSDRRMKFTQDQASEIYERKLLFLRSVVSKSRKSRAKMMKLECKSLSSIYGIDWRVVRDIWTRKSWVLATSHLWKQEESIASNFDLDESAV